jgi:hypothetical protein
LSDPLLTVRGAAVRAAGEQERAVLIDCDDCAVRDLQCGDCVMTVLLGVDGVFDVDDVEARALDALAEGGLVPSLRLVPRGVPLAPPTPAPATPPPGGREAAC